MRIVLNLLLVVNLLVSCQNDDDNSTSNSETDLELVTGIEIRNSQSSALMNLGNPNINTNQVIMYPNPPIDALRIDAIGNSGITDIWLVTGNAQKTHQDIDFDSLLSSDTYSESEIEDESEYYFSFNESGNAIINLENYSNGYYKVFVKINNQIEWNNVYVGNDMDIDDLMSFWD
ncbi:MAG: hypothetical protein HKO81_06260 [Flavobacteriaceae bacterium]|nr:hypothetical protein [Flavobacteriaceae bacterium]